MSDEFPVQRVPKLQQFPDLPRDLAAFPRHVDLDGSCVDLRGTSRVRVDRFTSAMEQSADTLIGSALKLGPGDRPDVEYDRTLWAVYQMPIDLPDGATWSAGWLRQGSEMFLAEIVLILDQVEPA